MKGDELVDAAVDGDPANAVHSGCDPKALRDRFAAHVGRLLNYADAILVRTRSLSSQLDATDSVVASLDGPVAEKLGEKGNYARQHLAAVEDHLRREIQRLRAEMERNSDCEVSRSAKAVGLVCFRS